METYTNMKVKVLASGSKGNSTLIRTDEINILIDFGINYQYLCSELDKINMSPKELDAILITHTHNDHIKGLASLVKKTGIKVYIIEEMCNELESKIDHNNLFIYKDYLELKDLKISTIRISHDVEGVGFIIENNNKSLVYITDTGYISEKNLKCLKNKNVYILESNHDEKMLMEGPYPYILKQRVISDKGHLSNSSTAEYLLEIVGNNTSKIVLAHISENNNTPELAIETTKSLLEENNIYKDIIAAKQYESLEEIEV